MDFRIQFVGVASRACARFEATTLRECCSFGVGDCEREFFGGGRCGSCEFGLLREREDVDAQTTT